jgi:WD40 repeat protein
MEKSTNRWLLATGDQGAQIVIWDLARRLPRSFCLGSTWKVSALAFHPDGLLLASAGRNDARLWDVMSGQPILLLRKTSGGDSRALAFDREGRRLISGGEPGDAVPTIGLWELEPHRGAQALRGLASAARKVWFSRDSARLAALSDDWHLAIWDLASGRLLFLFETPVGGFADSAGGCFDAEATRFAFASGREACLYDLATGGVARIWRLARGLSDQVQFDSHGRPLLLRRERASIQTREIWRLFELGAAETPVLLHEQSDTNWSAVDMRFAAGGERFLVWNGQPEGPPRIIRAYDAASGRELWHAATQRTAGAVAVVVDPTGQWFGYTADLSSRLRLVRFSDFTEIGTTVEFREAISPSGGEFVSGQAAFLDRSNADRAVPVVMDWQLLAFVSSFSPDGRLVAWGTEAGVVVVLHLEEVQQRLAGFRP